MNHYRFTLKDGTDEIVVIEHAMTQEAALAILAQTFDPGLVTDVFEVFTQAELSEQAAHAAMVRSRMAQLREWAAGQNDWDSYEQAVDNITRITAALEEINAARRFAI